MIRARFAPSPTGPIHIGNIRTALFNYLFTCSQEDKGKMVLRIEDTDLQRSSKEYEKLIFEELRWLGIEWDEGAGKGGDYGPYHQSERLGIYKQYIDKLIEEDKAYYCYCTPEELEKDRESSVAAGDIPRYSGRCRSITPEQAEVYEKEGRTPVVRFKIPSNQSVVFEDAVKGRIEINSDTLGGDMVIQKSDGMPTYNFAVVIDDHLMRITNVIRGEDHLSNTPKQILIYEALGWEKPIFAHAPLILGPDRTKLSKRHGNTYIGQYRKEGYLPEAMFNYLALLSWSPEGNEELLTKEEIIDQFRLERVTRANPVFDIAKLNWINAHYIRQLPLEKIVALSTPYLIKEGLITEEETEKKKEWLSLIVETVKESLVKISDITEKAQIFFDDRIVVKDDNAMGMLKGEHVPELLKTFRKKIEEIDEIDREFCKGVFKVLQKETGIRGKNLFMPVRVAITGQCHGPELVNILLILGKEKLIKRIDCVLNKHI